jgi:hypothetical protein
MPVKMLDPFTMAERADISVAATTQTVGRFAPVLGALQFPNTTDRLIDFANPRKKVEAKRPVARYIAAAAAGVAALGAGWWWYSSNHAALDSEIATLKQAVDGDAPILKTASKNIGDWKKLETFLKGDVLWIDELERLTTQAKDSETTYFGPTAFSLEPRTNAASVNTKFYTTVQDMVPEIQGAYRDENHAVRPTGLAANPDKKYPVASTMRIDIALNEVPDPRKVERKPLPNSSESTEAKSEDSTTTTEPSNTLPESTSSESTGSESTQPAPTPPEPTVTEPSAPTPDAPTPGSSEPSEPATPEPSTPAPDPNSQPQTVQPQAPSTPSTGDQS